MSKNVKRVCIYAPVPSGVAGGIEQFVLGLAAGLSKLVDGEEEYVFLVTPKAGSWVSRFLGGPTKLAVIPPARRGWRERARSVLEKIYDRTVGTRPNFPVLARLGGQRPRPSMGVEKTLGASVVHFPTQFGAFLTDLPSIYQPYDLQHLHFPQFFTKRARAERERIYRRYSQEASLVVTLSTWAREDVIHHYRLPASKVAVVPPGPPTAEYPIPTVEQCDGFKRRSGLPEKFLLYPAQTWPHKNHIGLMQALERLRDRGMRVHLVTCGRQNEFFPVVERTVRALDLQDQVKCVGFVTSEELQCLYRLCLGVVFPSLFEGGGLPVLEAQFAGVPVACSNVTCLPRLVSDSALVFNPLDLDQMADTVARLWVDGGLRTNLAAHGRANVARFTWEKTARMFRAHYRRLAGWATTEEDRALLDADPGL